MSNQCELGLNIAMTSLIVIARSGCREPCRWDNPCNACFASQIVAQLMDHKALKSWHRHYKIVAINPAKRRRNRETLNALAGLPGETQ